MHHKNIEIPVQCTPITRGLWLWPRVTPATPQLSCLVGSLFIAVVVMCPICLWMPAVARQCVPAGFQSHVETSY